MTPASSGQVAEENHASPLLCCESKLQYKVVSASEKPSPFC
jgi:hypothetical protein